MKDPNFKFINHNIIEPLNIEDKLDQIYNLACPASPPHYQKDPLFTINTCFIGITNMLNLAKKNKCKILQASTSEIYGDPIEHPQKETYWGHVNCFGIRSCYDEGKRSAETLCFNYINQYNVDVKVIRIFNTYGPSMAKDDGRVVTNFINQALYDEDITIYGDGSQTVFSSIDYKIKDIQRNIIEEYSSGLNPKEIELMKSLFGICDIDIRVNSVGKILLDELTDPFYLFQVYSVILWYCTEYYWYASVIVILTVISLIVSVHGTYKNLKQNQLPQHDLEHNV